MTDLQPQPGTAVTARPAATAPASSPDKWKPASFEKASAVRARLQARLKLSEALTLVGQMLDSFPGTETLDPDHYAGTLAAALAIHPREIAIACADIARGVVTECLFRQALTSARVHEWCKRHSADMQEWLARHEERAATANKIGPDKDRSNHETLDELRARLGPTFGLKQVARGGLGAHSDDDVTEEEAKHRLHERTQRAIETSSQAILGDYARRGIAPISTRGTWVLPVSPALAAQLGQLPQRRKGGRKGKDGAKAKT